MIFRTKISNQKPHPPISLSTREREKSRSDGILLTVGFNLRTRDAIHSPKSHAVTAQWRDNMSSLRDFGGKFFRLIRRLKPTVNKVLSLRDFSPLTQHYYKLFIFYP